MPLRTRWCPYLKSPIHVAAMNVLARLATERASDLAYVDIGPNRYPGAGADPGLLLVDMGRHGRGKVGGFLGSRRKRQEPQSLAALTRNHHREAPTGVEPVMEVLQTSALPLGYGAGEAKPSG